jgi:hypothetical protein
MKLRQRLICLFLATAVGLTAATAYPASYRDALPPRITKGSLHDINDKIIKLRKRDTLYLDIDSLGGSVTETISFLQQRFRSKGKLICTTQYVSASAAAIISRVCNKVYIKPKAYLLFHMPRFYKKKVVDGKEYVETVVISRKSKNIFLAGYYIKAVNMFKALGVDKLYSKCTFSATNKGKL